MENKEKNMKIRMEDVYEAIKKNGFYTTPMEKHYDENFVGPELIVVTDDPDFKVHHPELAEMNIMGTELFAEVAKEFNRYMHNNRRELWRQQECHDSDGYYEDAAEDENGNCRSLKIKDLPLTPVQDEVEKRELKEMIASAMTILNEKQYQRVYCYYFKGMTYRKIAALEGVSDMTIRESIDGALKKMKIFFENTPLKTPFPLPIE